jgi:hypothetical protein
MPFLLHRNSPVNGGQVEGEIVMLKQMLPAAALSATLALMVALRQLMLMIVSEANPGAECLFSKRALIL